MGLISERALANISGVSIAMGRTRHQSLSIRKLRYLCSSSVKWWRRGLTATTGTRAEIASEIIELESAVQTIASAAAKTSSNVPGPAVRKSINRLTTLWSFASSAIRSPTDPGVLRDVETSHLVPQLFEMSATKSSSSCQSCRS